MGLAIIVCTLFGCAVGCGVGLWLGAVVGSLAFT